MNLADALTLQRTAREVNDAAQRLQHAASDDAVRREAEAYARARRAHLAACADAEDPEGEAPKHDATDAG